MLRILVLIFASVYLVAGDSEIRHLELDGGFLIDTSPTKYAIFAPQLLPKSWKTLTVNDDKLFVTKNKPGCDTLSQSLTSLSNQEKAMIQTARAKFQSIENATATTIVGNGETKHSSTSFTLDGGGMANKGGNMGGFFLIIDEIGVIRYDLENGDFSVSKRKQEQLPNNWARVFLNGDVVTLVYRDGHVLSQPVSCLQPFELQMLKQVKHEVLENVADKAKKQEDPPGAFYESILAQQREEAKNKRGEL